MKTYNYQYPIAQSGISNFNLKYQEKFLNILPRVNQLLQQKEVISTEFVKIKDLGNRFVEAAYSDIISRNYLHSGAWEKQHNDMYMLSIPSEVRFINSFAKKLDKVSPEAKKTDMYDSCVKLTTEMLEIFSIFEDLKSYTIKAKDKKDLEKKEKNAIEADYIKKITSHADSKKVIQLLKETAKSIEERLYTSNLEHLNKLLELYKIKKEEGEQDYRKLYKNNAYMVIFLSSITERKYNNETRKYDYFIIDDVKNQIEKQSRTHAEDIINHFVYKNGRKLSYIMYSKNNLDDVAIKNINIRNGIVECDVICKFKDQSSFIANSSVVYSYSKYGNPFYRYPTTFRNVIMPDGNSLPQPSEQKMDEIFAITNSVKINKPKM